MVPASEVLWRRCLSEVWCAWWVRSDGGVDGPVVPPGRGRLPGSAIARRVVEEGALWRARPLLVDGVVDQVELVPADVDEAFVVLRERREWR